MLSNTEKAIKSKESKPCANFKRRRTYDDPETGRMDTERRIEAISLCTACFLWKNSSESDIAAMISLSAAGIKGHRCRRKDPCIAGTGADQTRTTAVKSNACICISYKFDPPIVIAAKVLKCRNEYGVVEAKEVCKTIFYSNSKDNGDRLIQQTKEVYEFQRVGFSSAAASKRNAYVELRSKIPEEVIQQLRQECQLLEHNHSVKWDLIPQE